jgi:hypothetical protein
MYVAHLVTDVSLLSVFSPNNRMQVGIRSLILFREIFDNRKHQKVQF